MTIKALAKSLKSAWNDMDAGQRYIGLPSVAGLAAIFVYVYSNTDFTKAGLSWTPRAQQYTTPNP